jgi:hypothetical protein
MNELLRKFESALRSHDWYYMMSDDSIYYHSGQLERNEISRLAKQLKDEGYLDQAVELWKGIAPYAPYMDTQFSFPINL